MADFLLEIGLEEVPARMLAAAQRELGARVHALLERERLLTTQPAIELHIETYSTPRRLAVLVRGVEPKQPDAQEQLTGPAWAIAFKNGAPTPAAHAFAKKAGVAVDQLAPLAIVKGEYASATVARPGRPAAELLAELLPKEIAALKWPKAMYWRAGKPERFVRPLQWIVALLDDVVIPVDFAGIHAGNQSYGHRVLNGAALVVIQTPASYKETLLTAKVMVDVEARRHTIRKALDRVSRSAPGARWREDEKLVDIVTHLTEWPSVLLGNFAPAYLALPEEVLVTVMRDHQKYFAVEDAAGKLLPHFLTVLNTAADKRGESIIRHGNERVLRARFNDAQFFWNFDQKISMTERIDLLKSVTFQKDLGTYFEKTERTLGIACSLADVAKRNGVELDDAVLERAVTLAKVDLTTELVKEFTELQGIIGGLYVQHASAPGSAQDKAVAQAMYWQYMPASIVDAVPPNAEGQILGLADRMGTIVDLFNIGLEPSGSKDPYALRRAANGVIKILAVSKLPLTLREVLNSTFRSHENETSKAVAVRPFLEERLSFYLREGIKVPADVVNAILAAGLDSVPDAQARAEALAQARDSSDLLAVAAAWKRIKNILRQATEKQFAIAEQVETSHLAEAAELNLWETLQLLTPDVEAFRAKQDYTHALEVIATLRPHVDRFFDETMVLVDDVQLRGNRLALLQGIVQELGRIADFSELSAPGHEPVWQEAGKRELPV